MNDAEPFIAEIVANPHDDAPRLIYADWLEERGDPLGEFIRVQCQLAQLPRTDPAVVTLRQREFALLRQHRAAWTSPRSTGFMQGKFARGFFEEAHSTMANLIKNADTIFLTLPLLRKLTLSDRMNYSARPYSSHLPRLLKLPYLRRITSLSLQHNGVDDRDAEAIAQSEHLTGLRFLNLFHNNIFERGARVLAESPYLQNLQFLGLEENPISPSAQNYLRSVFGKRVYLG